jgi:hypothetical protein
VSEDLTLVPLVQAHRALRVQNLRLQVLAPQGAWIGCGTLRVLRYVVRDDGRAELTAGYESYRPL